MRPYEQTLNKIAPVFFKFITHNEYFLTVTGLFTTYLSQAGFYSDISVSFPISINYIKNYINYLYYSKHILMEYKTRAFYPYIILGKINLYKKSNMFLSVPDVLTNMVINNFSFEKLNFLEDSKQSNKSLKDLFIVLVGIDTYKTIKNNIK